MTSDCWRHCDVYCQRRITLCVLEDVIRADRSSSDVTDLLRPLRPKWLLCRQSRPLRGVQCSRRLFPQNQLNTLFPPRSFYPYFAQGAASFSKFGNVQRRVQVGQDGIWCGADYSSPNNRGSMGMGFVHLKKHFAVEISSFECRYMHSLFTTSTTRNKTKSSAIAERPRDASCHWIVR